MPVAAPAAPGLKKANTLRIGVAPSQAQMGQGSNAQAVSYIEITTRSRRTLFGAGMHSNIITASLLAVISAVNRGIRLGHLSSAAEEVRTGT